MTRAAGRALVGAEGIMGCGCGCGRWGGAVGVGVEVEAGRGGSSSASSNVLRSASWSSRKFASFLWAFHPRMNRYRNNGFGNAATCSGVPFVRRVNSCI
jgi:hypothetical protein